MSHLHDDQPECHRYLEGLSDYVDGTLSKEFCAELEAHIAVCENCLVVVNTLAKTVSLYHRTPSPEIPYAVKERLYKVLDLGPYCPDSEAGADPQGGG